MAKSSKISGKAQIDMSHPVKLSEEIIQKFRRSAPGLVQLIQSIAANPDYLRMGPSHDMESGAPIVSCGTIPNADLGRPVTVADTDGSRYQMQYAVIEAQNALTAYNTLGQPNAEYQDDDAGRIRVIAGNARMAGISAAYEQGTAENYRNELLEDAVSSGVAPAQIEKMKSPVLVRVMQFKDLARDSGGCANEQDGVAMTAAERADRDRQCVELEHVETYNDGFPLIESLQNWISKQPPAEQSILTGKNGIPTRQAMERYRTAIFSKAYDSEVLTELYVEALGPDCKIIISGLERAAVKMAKLGSLPDGYDIRDIVGMATDRAVKAIQAGMPLEAAASQTDLFSQSDNDELARGIVRMFAENSRDAAAIGRKLSDLADALVREGGKQKGLPGSAVKRSPEGDVSQDRQSGKMSSKMYEFWQKHGTAFFGGFFSGVAQDQFFKALAEAAGK